MNYFNVNHFLTVSQHGFLQGHSTCTNLLESINDWTINVRDGHYTRVAYIDFAKAFDTVTHSKLLYKLRRLGIDGALLSTIESFLTNRSQRVAINGTLSKSVSMKSGVPQGSVLGPILFLVYINDLADTFPENITSKYFADDAKIYTEVSSGDDIDKLQFSLDELTVWAEKWQLRISITKCFTFDVLPHRNSDIFYNNWINDSELDTVTTAKDLGVLLDSKLKFHDHVLQVVAEAKKRNFLIYRCFCSRNINTLIQGFKSYILPMLNYCTPVWSPNLIQDIELIESVQRTFTKRLPGLAHMTYFDRLNILNLPSLELRRLRNDLILCYKILHKDVVGPPEKFGLFLSKRISRGHNLKLEKQCAPSEARKNLFGIRICNPWNSLPISVVNSTSVLAFKTKLMKVDLTKFLVCFDC